MLPSCVDCAAISDRGTMDIVTDDDLTIDTSSLRLSPNTWERLNLLPSTRLGPEQRSTTANLDLALGNQEDSLFAPEPTPVAPTQEELASLGQPFFEVKDPVEAARVNDFRLKYRSFRKGNAKGSKGEMKVLSRRCAAVEHSPKAHVPCAMASAGHGVRTKNAAVLDEAVGHSR